MPTGREFASRFSYEEMVLTLTAAAREIVEAWPKVKEKASKSSPRNRAASAELRDTSVSDVMEEFMNDKQHKSSVDLASGQEEAPKATKVPKNRKSKSKRNRKKTGSFRTYPRVPLERALLVALAIKEKNGGNPWPAEQVAAAVG
jgi:hypothetical protein